MATGEVRRETPRHRSRASLHLRARATGSSLAPLRALALLPCCLAQGMWEKPRRERNTGTPDVGNPAAASRSPSCRLVEEEQRDVGLGNVQVERLHGSAVGILAPPSDLAVREMREREGGRLLLIAVRPGVDVPPSGRRQRRTPCHGYGQQARRVGRSFGRGWAVCGATKEDIWGRG